MLICVAGFRLFRQRSPTRRTGAKDGFLILKKTLGWSFVLWPFFWDWLECLSAAIRLTDQWRSQRGVWGVQTPPLRKACIFYCLVNERKQWLIIKIVATRCRILRLKCIKFRFHGAPPDLLAGFKGSYF